MNRPAIHFAPTPASYLHQIQEALPALARGRYTGSPLAAYSNVQAVIDKLQPTDPVFCIKPEEIRASARRFRTFPGRVLYAVKCNPHPFVLETLFKEGITDFDVASLEEIRLVDGIFGKAAGQFFNNPAKTRPAVGIASNEYGIRFYTADCVEEVNKILDEAQIDNDMIIAARIATPRSDARYALSTKFGADSDEVEMILRHIVKRGVKAGISFHVGSQCLSPGAFETAIALTGKVLKRVGVPIHVLNVGGGFPAPYPGDELKSIEHYFSRIIQGHRDLQLTLNCMLLCEPGRSLVATSGKLVVQVVMRRGKSLFLNDGVFGTLQELAHPKERRPTRLIRKAGVPSQQTASFRIFGPTCDSNDVLGAPFVLPEDVREGDWIEVGMMGAYSLSMRTRFNGFFTDNIVCLTES